MNHLEAGVLSEGLEVLLGRPECEDLVPNVTYVCIFDCIVLYLSISIALLTAFQKRSWPQ